MQAENIHEYFLTVLFVSVPGLEFLEPARVIDTNTLHSSPSREDSQIDISENSFRYKRSTKDALCQDGMEYNVQQDVCLGNICYNIVNS